MTRHILYVIIISIIILLIYKISRKKYILIFIYKLFVSVGFLLIINVYLIKI